MNLLSLDQANHTGYAVFKNKKLTLCGVIDVSKYETYLEKKIALIENIINIIKQNNIDMIIMEETYMTPNVDTYKKLSELQIAIKDFCELNYIPYEILNSNSWTKRFLYPDKVPAKRSEKKKKVKEKVKELFCIDVNDDIADAVAMGWSYINSNPQIENIFHNDKTIDNKTIIDFIIKKIGVP